MIANSLYSLQSSVSRAISDMSPNPSASHFTAQRFPYHKAVKGHRLITGRRERLQDGSLSIRRRL